MESDARWDTFSTNGNCRIFENGCKGQKWFTICRASNWEDCDDLKAPTEVNGRKVLCHRRVRRGLNLQERWIEVLLEAEACNEPTDAKWDPFVKGSCEDWGNDAKGQRWDSQCRATRDEDCDALAVPEKVGGKPVVAYRRIRDGRARFVRVLTDDELCNSRLREACDRLNWIPVIGPTLSDLCVIYGETVVWGFIIFFIIFIILIIAIIWRLIAGSRRK